MKCSVYRTTFLIFQNCQLKCYIDEYHKRKEKIILYPNVLALSTLKEINVRYLRFITFIRNFTAHIRSNEFGTLFVLVIME